MQYHRLSRSQPSKNSKFPGMLSACGLQLELATVSTRRCPLQPLSTICHRFRPILEIWTSPSFSKIGGGKREERKIVVSDLKRESSNRISTSSSGSRSS